MTIYGVSSSDWVDVLDQYRDAVADAEFYSAPESGEPEEVCILKNVEGKLQFKASSVNNQDPSWEKLSIESILATTENILPNCHQTSDLIKIKYALAEIKHQNSATRSKTDALIKVILDRIAKATPKPQNVDSNNYDDLYDDDLYNTSIRTPPPTPLETFSQQRDAFDVAIKSIKDPHLVCFFRLKLEEFDNFYSKIEPMAKQLPPAYTTEGSVVGNQVIQLCSEMRRYLELCKQSEAKIRATIFSEVKIRWESLYELSLRDIQNAKRHLADWSKEHSFFGDGKRFSESVHLLYPRIESQEKLSASLENLPQMVDLRRECASLMQCLDKIGLVLIFIKYNCSSLKGQEAKIALQNLIVTFLENGPNALASFTAQFESIKHKLDEEKNVASGMNTFWTANKAKSDKEELLSLLKVDSKDPMSWTEIRNHCKKWMTKGHPDKAPTDQKTQATALFQKVQTLYSRLETFFSSPYNTDRKL